MKTRLDPEFNSISMTEGLSQNQNLFWILFTRSGGSQEGRERTSAALCQQNTKLCTRGIGCESIAIFGACFDRASFHTDCTRGVLRMFIKYILTSLIRNVKTIRQKPLGILIRTIAFLRFMSESRNRVLTALRFLTGQYEEKIIIYGPFFFLVPCISVQDICNRE
jgi:hypothetical protein